MAAATRPLYAQFQFVEAGAESGLGDYVMETGVGGGVAAADFDEDGDIDLFVANGNGVPDQLYRNLGNGLFEEIGVQAGVGSVENNRVGLWFDYDGDHQLDLIVGGDCRTDDEECAIGLRLYRKVGEVEFTDVSADSGIAAIAGMFPDSKEPHFGGITAGDINNDGYLDLALAIWDYEGRLLLNNGDGTFSDISDESGIRDVFRYWQHTLHDFNGDGWLDIHSAVDLGENRFWINQGDNTFVDLAPSLGLDNHWDGMGTTLGDYDNDGDLDIYVTNITRGGRFNPHISQNHRKRLSLVA